MADEASVYVEWGYARLVGNPVFGRLNQEQGRSDEICHIATIVGTESISV